MRIFVGGKGPALQLQRALHAVSDQIMALQDAGDVFVAPEAAKLSDTVNETLWYPSSLMLSLYVFRTLLWGVASFMYMLEHDKRVLGSKETKCKLGREKLPMLWRSCKKYSEEDEIVPSRGP